MNTTYQNDNTICESCDEFFKVNKKYIANWLKNYNPTSSFLGIVEVVFKNNRKAFYKNSSKLKLKLGDVVVVECLPGHDIGKVSMLDDIFFNPIMKKNLQENINNFKKIYSIAKPHDFKNLKEARALEKDTLVKSREIINNLNLKMKLSDVEYQGDKQKAYFYYIADERVDFRKLIKLLAEKFNIQVVMKQIGARQESSYVAGIGVCGRKICCATWLNKLESISISSVKSQDISMNPQKLTGQCGKLKCCLRFELQTYINAKKMFPPTNIPIETQQGKAIFQKADILKGLMWFSYEDNPLKQIPLNTKQVKKMLQLNKKGIKATSLHDADYK